MKITELIAELNEILAEHGDIEVRYTAQFGSDCADQVIVTTNLPYPPIAVII